MSYYSLTIGLVCFSFLKERKIPMVVHSCSGVWRVVQRWMVPRGDRCGCAGWEQRDSAQHSAPRALGVLTGGFLHSLQRAGRWEAGQG